MKNLLIKCGFLWVRWTLIFYSIYILTGFKMSDIAFNWKYIAFVLLMSTAVTTAFIEGRRSIV